jgi:hypothetical protein
LEEAQVPNEWKQPARTFRVEQLRSHRDPARVRRGELVNDRHDARLGGGTDGRHDPLASPAMYH